MPPVREHEFDVVIIGMGPGGEHIGNKLAEEGVSVAAVEQRLVGGECPYWGCTPSKMMVRAGNLLAEGRRISALAGASVISPDWAPVASRIRDATSNWDDKAAADRFAGNGGTLYRGHGTLTGRGTVSAGGVVLRARRGIVIDVGAEAQIPPIDGLAETPYWTNREAVEADQIPASLIVLGGGPLGLEFAQVFARFGAVVTVVEALDRLLAGEEPESGELIAKVFTAEGISVVTGSAAKTVRHDATGFRVALASGRTVTGERLLVATGRKPDLAAAGVAAIGQDEHASTLTVDEHMLAAPGVWAVGDAVGHGAYTHMALYQARIIVDQLLGRPHDPAEYHAVPRVTFTDPEIGAVGLTEAQATERLGGEVRTGIRDIPDSSRGWLHKAGNDGFIKLVADTGRGVLVGATSAGPVGGEVLSMLTLAVHARIPLEQLKRMIYAYPTFHGAVAEAIGRLS
jgi:pyruvate/2-oxoglutarate dehydrogenase complex dihydrolipoamide dehydrogenase (E3) component